MKTVTTRTGHQLEVGGIAAAGIPANWAKKAVLARKQTGERFAFYALADGRVAQVCFHPMNGADDMFVRIGDRDFMAGEYQELLEGERFTQRTDIGYGRIDVRRGRYAKCQRVA